MKTVNANQWTRCEFTVQSVLAMLSGVAITISGCGDSNSSTAPTPTPTPTPTLTPTPPPAGNNDVAGVVGSNHGHSVAITGAQLTAGNAVNLDITGNANHPHTVDLSAAEVGQIAGGMQVHKPSSNNSAHAHTVTFN